MTFLVVGSGLSGAVIAERLVRELDKNVLVLEKRDHIGGNCFDYIDETTGILMNKYGAHLFHTNDEGVWKYIQQFATWVRWDHEVKALVDGKLVPMPVNRTTVNRLLNLNLETDAEMEAWLAAHQVSCDNPRDSREMALSRIGQDLYDLLVRNYTYKQWGKYPEELDASVLARIPVRKDVDPRYFTDKYQALPKEGYTHFVHNILAHPNIEVRTGVDFLEWRKTNDLSNFEGVIYTGPIDGYFAEAGLAKLEYRSIDFHIEHHLNTPFFQTASVVNRPGLEVPYTRTVEYKHFLEQTSPHTVIVHETTNDDGEPYYPVPTQRNQDVYRMYQALAAKEESEKNVWFVGRLASYKYFNMDAAIRNALDMFEKIRAKKK